MSNENKVNPYHPMHMVLILKYAPLSLIESIDFDNRMKLTHY